MSSTMYWRPAPQEIPPANELPVTLKKRISQRLWGHDGSLTGESIEVGSESLPYLEGLADAGTDGAEELIQAIRKHGSVLVWIGG